MMTMNRQTGKQKRKQEFHVPHSIHLGLLFDERLTITTGLVSRDDMALANTLTCWPWEMAYWIKTVLWFLPQVKTQVLRLLQKKERKKKAAKIGDFI
jgi:hypothetical protein